MLEDVLYLWIFSECSLGHDIAEILPVWVLNNNNKSIIFS